ncbi:adenylate cyclase type 10 isoform X1 [Fukomys damarensis]|uniref:adenylate cyclase type 10 isoform X1 n=2 Tax=Fukomys damarensis TaxID=885580 RepID=UPI000540174A|nr:adenylate cyclase type 10 isoform X1 [Fukomys damarensis]XP_019064464.1 adenylate cyclase type 10 isoform X1 [Fukomys damarensis]
MNTQKESQDNAIVRIAAHLPDLIVYGNFSPERPSVDYFDGVLMFVDISGFTAMTEKFSTAMYMDRGAEQLVDILNHYISAIVEKVLLFGGDILKFAGDALLALWKVERKQLKNTITVVVKCSLEIHGLFDEKEMEEEGLDIQVKIGLSAGHITMVVFGDERRNYFLVTGQAVDDVRLAQNLAQMNDVILSPNCWQLCDRNMVEMEKIPDQRAVKVKFLKLPPTFNFDEFFKKCMTFMNYYPSSQLKTLRLACLLESNAELEGSLQKYLMESILKQIDDRQLHGYLSELRPVTIVFVNLLFKDRSKVEAIGSAIQSACEHITSVLQAFRGQINKVFMFDKGCSFLCVFGFPGEKEPNEVTHALESAVDIFDFCSKVPKIHTVSIGVASGIVFCGIIGHSTRHEYTVIGRKVNIAARMMMYYPGVVTCDSVTYSSSSLPAYFFKELPKKVMKGVADSGPVYQCLGLNEEVVFGMANLRAKGNESYPLLGRDKEIKYFMDNMKKFLITGCSRVLIYEGNPGYGKSQILKEIEYLAQGERHRTVAIALTKISFHQNFYTIQIFMANVLGLDTCKHYKERQINIQNKVRKLMKENFYCLLNDIFHVQFPTSREISRMNALKKQKQVEKLFMKMLEKTSRGERIILIIDEAQFVDHTSWAFLEKLIQTVPIFIIMSLSPFVEDPCAAATAIMKNRNTTYITLGAVLPKDIRNKACFDLNVTGISRELDMYLVEGSCGIPFYCEELLLNLDHHKVLLYRAMESGEKSSMTWNNMFKSFIKSTDELKIYFNEEGNDVVCHLASGVRLKNLSLPMSLKEVSLIQLDSMSLSHQMLVRCAAITGLTCTTELLFQILPCWNVKMMIEALTTLVEADVFVCFQNGRDLRLAQQQDASFEVHHRSSALQPSDGTDDKDKDRELQELHNEVIQCHIIRFCKPMMQKAAYELWLKDEKRAMHLKCAHFLEENAHRCGRCQGTDFVPYHHFAVDIWLNKLDMDTMRNLATPHSCLSEEEAPASRLELRKKPELFPEDLSPEEIKEKILGFFDTVIDKMQQGEETLVPQEPCQCEDILTVVILPLAQHFVALEENHKALYYFLEIASACLLLGDNYMAYVHLNEGHRLLRILKKEKTWSHTFELATFYTLKGQICFNMGQMVLAKKTLRKALRLLNRVFPHNLLSLFFHDHMERKKHSHYLNQQVQDSPPGRKRLAELYQQEACFSLLWKIYSCSDYFHKCYAHLTAMMQVNTALETQNDFQIVKAFLDYSLFHQLAGHQGVWFPYELKAMELIAHLPLEGEAIEMVAYVAHVLSHIKFFMGHLDLAIELGFRAQKMWALLQNPNKYCSVLCRLSSSLLLRNRYKQLIPVLQSLWRLSSEEEHIFSKAYFYFMCLDIMLYCGFVYKPFEECLQFVSLHEDNTILRFHSGILLGFYSGLAIWYARLQEWDNFTSFFSKAKSLVTRRTMTTDYYAGTVKYVEGQVLHLQRQIEEQSHKAQDSGVELLKNLENLLSQNTTGAVFHPRLYHMMAYVCMLMGDGRNCHLFLSKALEISETQGNVLEKSWLLLSKEWWYSNAELMEDQWLHTVLTLPSWEKIASGRTQLQAHTSLLPAEPERFKCQRQQLPESLSLACPSTCTSHLPALGPHPGPATKTPGFPAKQLRAVRGFALCSLT